MTHVTPQSAVSLLTTPIDTQSHPFKVQTSRQLAAEGEELCKRLYDKGQSWPEIARVMSDSFLIEEQTVRLLIAVNVGLTRKMRGANEAALTLTSKLQESKLHIKELESEKALAGFSTA